MYGPCQGSPRCIKCPAARRTRPQSAGPRAWRSERGASGPGSHARQRRATCLPSGAAPAGNSTQKALPCPTRGWTALRASVYTGQGSSPVVGRQPPGNSHQKAPCAPASVHLGQVCPSHLSGKKVTGSTDNSSLFLKKTF